MIEIVNEYEPETMEFKYLNVGDIFLYDDDVYMKISMSMDTINSVNLKHGYTEVLDYHSKVIEVQGKLIIS